MGHQSNRMEGVKKMFPNILNKNKGFIATTCRELSIHRNTYYKWYKEDEDFAEMCDEVIDFMGDWVEGKLFENIEKNDTVAIKFCLSTKYKNRGYTEKENISVNINNAQDDKEEDMGMLKSYIQRQIDEGIKQELVRLGINE
jgi:putative insertion element HTH domain-containing protein